MAENTENHTIKLLQEMRTEMREGFDSVNKRIDTVTSEMNGRFDDVETSINGPNPTKVRNPP